MLGYQETTDCRMNYLRAQLDDDPGSTGLRAVRQLRRAAARGDTDLAAVTAARTRLSVPGVPVEPRASGRPACRRWVSRCPGRSRSANGRAGPRGRPAGRPRLGLGAARRAAVPATPDGETPVPLRHAAVQVLDAWPEAAGFDGVVYLESAARRELIAHLAGGLARYRKAAAADPVRADQRRPAAAVGGQLRAAAEGRARAASAGRPGGGGRPRGCCWSTTAPTAAGRSRSPRGNCAGPARGGLPFVLAVG